MDIFQQLSQQVILLLQQISALPGSLVYQIILLAALMPAAIIAHGQWRRGHMEGRLALAALGLFCLRLIFLAVELGTTYLSAQPLLFLPPLDRAVATLSILLLIWAFTFPQANRPSDAIIGLLSITALLGLFAGWWMWNQEIANGIKSYNFNSTQEAWWEIAKMVLLGGGLLLTAIRRKAEWPIGFATLAVLLAGHLIHYLNPVEGNVAGVERLADIVALPMFAAFIYRSIRVPTPVVTTVTEATLPNLQAQEHIAQLQQELDELRARAEKAQQDKLTAQEAAARATAALRQNRTETEKLTTQISQMQVELDSQQHEAENLSQELQAQITSGERPATLMTEVSGLHARLQEAQRQAEELQRMKSEYEAAARSAEAHRLREAELAIELEHARTKLEKATEQALTLESATTSEEGLSEEAQAALAAAKSELRDARKQLKEKERLLAEARDTLEAHPLQQPSLEEITNLAQELRQPVMSISGYTDLLLGESVGLLSSVQRKFIERIKASCARLEVTFSDLARMTDTSMGQRTLARENVEIVRVIEEVVHESEGQFRQKRINLRLNLPDNVPPIPADREALHKILGHLLHNAASASLLESDVELNVKYEVQQAQGGDRSDCVVIAVRDSGGGISLADQGRVFLRPTGGPTLPIPGVGETDDGLFTAKTLVEAHGGRIWVSSEEGVGSTFSILLPITLPAAPPKKEETPQAEPAAA